MLIIVILLAMFVGWGAGAYFLDKWVNDESKKINKEDIVE
jgi:hypothetical protein